MLGLEEIEYSDFILGGGESAITAELTVDRTFTRMVELAVVRAAIVKALYLRLSPASKSIW